MQDVEIDPRRSEDRHVPIQRSRRSARQQDRLGDPDHPPPDQYRRDVPERAIPAPEQGYSDETAEIQAAGTERAGA